MSIRFNPLTGSLDQVGATEQDLQSAVQRVEGTASVVTTASATLPADSAGPVGVTLADPEFLGTETSIKGLLGTIYGVLSRAADGSYSFTSEQTYTGAVTLGSGTRFATAALPSTFNPLRVGNAELQEDLGYVDTGYAYTMLDASGRIAWGIKSDGTVAIKKALVEGNGIFESDVTIQGDLTVQGTTVTIDVTDLTIEDNTILLNKGESGSGVTLGSAGIEVDRGTADNVKLEWNETNQAWTAEESIRTNSSVFFGSSSSENNDSYIEGSGYIEVVVDSAGRIGYGLKTDGTFDVPSGNINLGDAKVQEDDSYTEASGYAYTMLDAAGRIAWGVKADGSVKFTKLTVTGNLTAPSLAADDTALYESKLVGNDFHIFKNALGQETQLTSIGSNYNVNLTGESPQRLIFISTRSGTARPTVMNKDGSAIALAAAPKIYVMWGDSLTGNLRGIIPNNGHTVVTQAFLDTGLTTLDNERRLVNVGIGSQTAIQIAARQGGLATTCQVTGGSIPASGSVGLTAVYPDLLYNPTLDSRLNNFPVTINGVSGTLTRNTSTTYTFTRSASGASVTASGTVTIKPNTADASPIIAVDLFAPSAFSGANLNEYTAILWLGHNGVGDSGAVTGPNGETLLSLIQGCVSQLRNLSKRFLILPVFNATAASGSGAYLSAQTNYWTPLATAFPDNYYDIRRDFIDNAKTWMQTNYPSQYASDWGQSFIPSRASAGSDSDYDISNDMIPRALRADTVHLNDMGSDLFAELLAAKLILLGW